jgi:uncharacterized integral membrane protein
MTTASLGEPGKKRAVGHQPNRFVAFLRQRWLPLLIVIVALVFIGSNGQTVTVHFFGAHFQARLWLMLLITAALGFLAGWLFQSHRQGRKAATGGPNKS